MNSNKFLISGNEMLKNRPKFNMVGRSNEVKQIIKALGQRYAHNVILRGPSGAGSTAICLGLQQVKEKPDAPVDIAHKRIYHLDTDMLFSDMDNLSENFDKVMKKLTDTPDNDTLLIIEDAKDFIDAVENSGNKHFINRLMRSMESGSFQSIWEVREGDFDYVIKTHSHMRENFTVIDIEPPKGESLEIIIDAATEKLQAHHNVDIDESAKKRSIELTTKYPGKEQSLCRAQPEASLTLIDRACTSYIIESHIKHPSVVLAENKYEKNPSEENKALLDSAKKGWESIKQGLSKACLAQSETEQKIAKYSAELDDVCENDNPQKHSDLTEFIEELKERLSKQSEDVKQMISVANNGLVLTSEHINAEFTALTGLEPGQLNDNTSDKLLSLPEFLKSKIIGQDHAVEKLSNAILVGRTEGLKQKGKPEAAFLFGGPSGTGKTEIAKQLAEHLTGDQRDIVRFDMSDFKEEHGRARLIGAPPGYAGFEEGGLLTNAVMKNPNAIILLDEIEKAHPTTFDIFLQVLDDARLQDSMGRVADFNHTTLLFTTNIGSEHLLDETLSYSDQRKAMIESLEEVYRPEFLNRFAGKENIVGFKSLPLSVIELIAKGEVKKLNKGLSGADHGISVFMSEENIKDWCKDTYDPKRGARAVSGMLQDKVYASLAKLIHQRDDSVSSFDIIYNNGSFELKGK